MEDSIFTKIIKGEIPCEKVYEDEQTIAFLDIRPVTAGHTLVAPKNQVQFIWDLDDVTYTAVMHTAKRVAQRLREVTGAPYIGETIVGTDVPHAHVHVIAFERSEQLKDAFNADRPVTDSLELAMMAEKLRI